MSENILKKLRKSVEVERALRQANKKAVPKKENKKKPSKKDN